MTRKTYVTKIMAFQRGSITSYGIMTETRINSAPTRAGIEFKGYLIFHVSLFLDFQSKVANQVFLFL